MAILSLIMSIDPFLKMTFSPTSQFLTKRYSITLLSIFHLFLLIFFKKLKNLLDEAFPFFI